MGNYALQTETDDLPLIRAGFGVQGIGVGNPGYFMTAEKNRSWGDVRANGYLGFGLRSNENHGHMLGGLKASRGAWSLGVQADGHNVHPFTTWSFDGGSVGVYLVESKSLGIMLSLER